MPGDCRPNWDEWGMLLATAVASRADCSRRKVGAVIIKDNRVVATGYNGAAPGKVGCLSGGCPRASSDVPAGSSYDTGPGSCIAVHAELNAIMRASWDDMDGATLYVTAEPCDGCAKIIEATPIKWVHYKEE